MQITTGQFRTKLLTACRYEGSQRAAARKLGVSAPYLNDVLNGKREPGDKIANALGWQRIVRYIPLQGQK